jgi:hypothetical protein
MARKARAKKSKAPKERPQWLEAFSFRAAGAMALALAGLGATVYGVAAVHARASDLLAAKPTTAEIVWPRLAGAQETWLGETLREQIVARVEAQLAGAPLDAVALARVGESLATSGWFDTPPRVERTADGTVLVRGHWRQPACAIRSGPRDYALDWQGRPFPVDYPAGTSGLRVILGAFNPPPLGRAGELDVMHAWPGDDVVAGLGLLAPLLREPFAGQVAGVDVSGYFAQGQLAIVTDTGSRVVWGGRFGEFIPGEASSEDKLARLRSLAANVQFGNRIDMGQNRLEIFDERYFALDLTGRP